MTRDAAPPPQEHLGRRTRRIGTIATWRDVKDRLGRADVVILDTRSDGEYNGTTVRAKRGGAIPGAVHLEWTRNLGPDGAFKPAAELQAMYEAAGVTPDKEVVTYCQGGYRAAHSYLALRLLGYPRVRNYIGSWKEWGDREDLPIEKPARQNRKVMNNVIDFINTNRDRYVDELKAYLAIPSISALPRARGRRARAAPSGARDEMRRIGLQNVRLDRDARPSPSSTATGSAPPGAPTILFYGHYDVQPVDPLDLWDSPPFEATVRDGEIYARGSADDKGQVFMHFKAIEAHLKQNGKLPVNIKIILEGEEEVGSAQSRRLRQGPQGRARGRRRRHLRLADVRPRHPVDLLRPARPGLLPDRSARHQVRPALGIVRRRGRQSRHGAGADPGADEGQAAAGSRSPASTTMCAS